MNLPQDFLARMEDMLGEEFDAFLRTYDEPRRFGLRVNTLKISVDEFVRLAPFHLTKIPWIDNGFYYEKEDDPARHPFYYAGLYYLQEPSAMTPADVLPVTPGQRVLDLCAAPGGKATALAAKLQGKGLLVANDISASRAKALLKNLEVFGVKNSFVTNAAPYRLAQQFPEAFDRILVDAPCSGEGMFRKDIANARAWSPEKVEECARIQRDITQEAVKMLRPGGLLLYSTCTFSPEENEGTIAYLLRRCPEMELVCLPQKEGFAHGDESFLDMIKERETETRRALWEAGVWQDACAAAQGGGQGAQNTEEGERGERAAARIIVQSAQNTEAGASEEYAAARIIVQSAQNSEAGASETCDGNETLCGADHAWDSSELRKCVRIFPHKMGGEGHFLALLRKKGELPEICASAPPNAKRLAKDDEKVLREFLQDVSADFRMEQIEVHGGQAYFIPQPPQISGRLAFLRNGLYLGEIRKNRFEPSQSFAMALKKDEYASVLDFSDTDERVRRYLCGETVEADDLAPRRSKGWQLVCVDGYPLGWGKLVNGTLKNKYHPGWRMQS